MKDFLGIDSWQDMESYLSLLDKNKCKKYFVNDFINEKDMATDILKLSNTKTQAQAFFSLFTEKDRDFEFKDELFKDRFYKYCELYEEFKGGM